MGRRRYTNTAIKSYITTALNGVDVTTAISVSATSGGATAPPVGWPAVPFFAAINRGAADEEVVKVTAVAGSTVTFTRGSSLGAEAYGSTTQTHSINAVIEHVMAAGDLDEANDHINDSTDVHGVSGTLVGTAGAQTLTGPKTLTAPVLTAPVIADFTSAAHDHGDADDGGTIAHSVLTGLTAGDPHTQYVLDSEKAAASGVATLDAAGRILEAQLGVGLITAAAQGASVNVNGSTATVVETGDFALVAGRAYEVTVHVQEFDPDSTDLVLGTFAMEASLDSGGAWGSFESSNIGAFYMGNAGSGLVTPSSGKSYSFIASAARATYRLRLRVVRTVGTGTAVVSTARIFVKCIGHDLS